MDIRHRQLSAPLMAHLEITNICNHRCLHCYKLDADLQNRPKDVVNNDTIIQNVHKLIDGGILQIIITGGEPLLKKDLVKNIIEIANQRGISVSINTNLTLADDDIIDYLSKTNTRVLTSCPSGIESSFEKLTITKNFATFKKNLVKAINAGIKTTVNMVITKDNIDEIRQTANEIRNLGCTSFCTTPVALNMEYPRYDLLLSREDIAKLVDDILWIEAELGMKVDILDGLPKCVFPKDILVDEHLFLYRRCQAGRTFIAVSPNGDVRPCANTNESYGNIHSTSLAEIWQKMQVWRSDVIVPEECQGCSWINRCLGGCRTNAKALTGKWNGTDIWEPVPIKDAPPSHAKQVKLDNDSILRTNPAVKFRREGENVYLAYSIKNRTFCMLNESMLNFITFIKESKEVKYSDILSKYSTSNDVNQINAIITILVQYKIIKL